MLALIYSARDPAGSGTARIIRELLGGDRCSLPRAVECTLLSNGVYLVGFDADSIFLDFLGEVLPANIEGYVVLSRHSGGKPSLTVHHTGNPGPEAPYGGKPWSLAPAWPRTAAGLLRTYRRVAEEMGLTGEFQVTLEATHHGPTELEKPIVFIEIGSSEREWVRRDTQNAMAETVIRFMERDLVSVECSKVAIGIGDTHYPIKHTRNVLERGYCYSHIFSKHVLDNLTLELLEQALEKTRDKVDTVVLAKVPSRVKQLARSFAEKYGLQLEK
ncbi:D-aminoacyl-tRNA deacylase [Hyperthermus butylicus]|uniref:D-aminoacyl-tRNA deacylase n=1 Tax=Hyperthermus butylicus (strain DSM 5456 / JCM 9403 / PLM1-5) TaxID=415426 RepID=DTDA_HYPBU|nr:D-aminoacyl-tRNA deacylase [Hyperthermus butylicus]A2BKX3.1 RecName: Full=D-aminoacyl-tRNA deacylase; AltName: Full=D-tyrosyl-tRNA(Tyr) deacylase [Hyperthermus butylicus DSM 5456]ABM80634.1 universally conserved protein [Hyperthermus butylicus DSM 5456]